MSGNLLICGFQIPEENRNNLLEAVYGRKKMRERSLTLRAAWRLFGRTF
jgi:hypothetical protein